MGSTDPKIKINLTENYVPEKLAQRCPVCNGFGTLKYGEKVCQACSGKGYVLVPARNGSKNDI
ncbi:MAG: hypothetical protein A2172_05385 [Candidatus Woykebacteria bacterium RBG_13_40_15]|uniref:Uncharacterized protein n=1 Tax=Candidatus Woykebacteria bacterium RBG_13_40_15 TaxID=1802593 RepID=A0A1G1W8Z5_9BACT|nr:MAG: hypothetical protein A2172_05385 [Candidatus Woykebacteria bacterium RBG_13_40_15]